MVKIASSLDESIEGVAGLDGRLNLTTSGLFFDGGSSGVQITPLTDGGADGTDGFAAPVNFEILDLSGAETGGLGDVVDQGGTDTFGILGASQASHALVASGTWNGVTGTDESYQTAFDVSGSSALTSISFDAAAMGDFETGVDLLGIEVLLDGNLVETMVFDANEALSQSYTMESGAVVMLDDPLSNADGSIVLSNQFQTVTLTGIAGMTGSNLNVNVYALTDNETPEVIAVKNIVVEGDEAAGPKVGTYRISEILFNPPGADTGNEYIEIQGQPGETIPDNTVLVQMNGDSEDNPGWVDQIFDLSGMTFGANGMLVLLQAGSPYTPDADATVMTADGPGWGASWSGTDGDLADGTQTWIFARFDDAGDVPGIGDDMLPLDDPRGLGDAFNAEGTQTLDTISYFDGGDNDVGTGLAAYSVDGDGLTEFAAPVADISALLGAPVEMGYLARLDPSFTQITTEAWLASALDGAAPALNTGSGVTVPDNLVGEPVDYNTLPLNHLGLPNNFVAVVTEPEPDLPALRISEIQEAIGNALYEFVELYNAGDTVIDLAGYVLDDDDPIDGPLSGAPGAAPRSIENPNILGGTINPGESAVLYNADAISAAEFSAAWGEGLNLIPVVNWSAIDSIERIGLWDSFGAYSFDGFDSAVIDITVVGTSEGGSMFLSDLDDQNSFVGADMIGEVTPVGTTREIVGVTPVFRGSPGGDPLVVNPVSNDTQATVHSSIQDAVDAANDGDMLSVDEDNYALNEMVINSVNNLTLDLEAPDVTEVRMQSGVTQFTHTGSSDVILRAANEDTTLQSGAGNDSLFGARRDDMLSGGDGDDVLITNLGSDFAYGGAGNDTIRTGLHQTGDFNTLDGGDGLDTLDFVRAVSSLVDAGIVIEIDAAGSGLIEYASDRSDIGTFTSIERILGTTGNDVIVSLDETASIRLEGLNGDDRLGGGMLNDRLEGGAGNDVMTGGEGADLFDGGAGRDRYASQADGDADRFIFDYDSGTDTGSGVDRIQGFEDGIDLIEISNVVFADLDIVDYSLPTGPGAAIEYTVAGTISSTGGSTGIIFVDGVSAADLTADDFIFV